MLSENCCICDEKINKTNHSLIHCPYCSFEACRSCCETFVLDKTTAICMNTNCGKEWTRKQIVQLFTKLASGAKGKLLIPLIEGVQKIANKFINTKFGQLLKKLGSGIITTITSLISNLTTKLISMLNSIAKQFPKLTSWCKQIINIISNISSAIRKFVGIIWQSLKVLWQIISAPGKSASWIVQKLMPGSVVVKGAFGTGAKVYVNLLGINYTIMPEIEKLINPAVQDPMETLAANMETAIRGNIMGLPKTGNIIHCYVKDANGKYTHKGQYEIFYVPVTVSDSTTLQPCVITMHTDTKEGNWIKIDMTKDIAAYNNKDYDGLSYWADARQLKQLNKNSLSKYIIKNKK